MAAGSIIIDLLMRTGSFETDTKRGQKALRELKKEAQDAGKIIGASLAGVGIAAAYAVGKQLEAADAAGKAAQTAGVSVEAYTALAYAADLAGVNNESLSKSLLFLNKAIAGNADAFKELGINVTGAGGELRKADDVILELADAFAGMADGPKKAELATKLFGKAGAELIPFLNAGRAGISALTAEAARLGVVIDSETAAAAEQFNDNLTRMHKASQGLTLQLAKELLPVLGDLAERTVKNAKDFGLLEGAFIAFYERILGGTETADLLEKQSRITTDSLKGLREEIEKLTKQGVGEQFQGGVLGQLRARLAEEEARAKTITQDLTNALNAAAGRGTFGRGVGFADPRLIKPGGKVEPKADTKKQSEAERYLETLQKQGEEMLKLSAYEKALGDIQKGRIDGITPALKRAILEQAKQNDQTRIAIELRDSEVAGLSARSRAQLDNIDALQKGNKELQAEIDLIGLDELASVAVERARTSSTRALKEEELARKAAAGAADETLQALEAEIAALKEREDLLGKKIGKTLDQRTIEASSKSAEKISTAFADSIEEGILDGFRRGSSLTDVFLNELKAQFAKTVLRPLIEPIAAGGNDFVSQLIGAAVGAFSGMSIDPNGAGITSGNDSGTGSQIRGRRAGGGDANPNPFGALLVGEKGPELFKPSTSGRIIPNDALGGGREPKVTIENYGARIEQRKSSNGDLRLIIDAVKSEMNRDIASGTGGTARAIRSRGVNLDRVLARRA
jgi:hypothetical protein